MILTILIATIVATSLMTLFSYLVSWMLKQPYKEPFLLAALLRVYPIKGTEINTFTGWVLHYVLGLIFVLGFEFLLHNKLIETNVPGALLYGILIGIIGIIGWKIIFHNADKKPNMDYNGYYTQLFLAHLVFSFAMIGCYGLTAGFVVL